jgi:hypothetical protein
MPYDDLLEEVEAAISLVGMRKISEGGVAAVWTLECAEGSREINIRPRQDRDKGDTNDEGILDAESHEKGCDDTTTEDSNPQLLLLARNIRQWCLDNSPWGSTSVPQHTSLLH